MTPILVDSNIILDIATRDPAWGERSGLALSKEAERAPLVINPIIFAEVSVGHEKVEELDIALPPALFNWEDPPWEAAFLAGKCFPAHRRRGGARSSTLPDFFIGAHAAIAGYRLLTRDAARYRIYFPGLEILVP